MAAIGNWPLTDGSGTTAVDHSVNGNNGTLLNGAVFVSGPLACFFDGDDDEISGPSVGLDIDVDLTLATWIQRTALSKRGGLIAKTNGSAWNFDLLISNSFTGNEITFYADSLSPSTVDSAAQVADLNWNHVAITYERSSGTLIFYINGVAVDTHVGLGGGPGSVPGESMFIGSEGDPGAGSNDNFQGEMRQVLIYSTVLTPAEIAALAVPTFLPPTVTGVSPSSGTTAGATPVTVTGTRFSSTISSVTFGGASATSVVRVSDTSITCHTPAHAAGVVDVIVTNNDAQTGTLVNGYTYTAPAPGGHGPLRMSMGIGLRLS